jgi:hypothetical protein
VKKETKRPPRVRRRSPTDLAARLDALDYRRDDQISIEADEFRFVSERSGGFARGKFPSESTVKLGNLVWAGKDDKTGENAALYEIDDKSFPSGLEYPPDEMAKLETWSDLREWLKKQYDRRRDSKRRDDNPSGPSGRRINARPRKGGPFVAVDSEGINVGEPIVKGSLCNRCCFLNPRSPSPSSRNQDLRRMGV